jgi:hypothetical protein
LRDRLSLGAVAIGKNPCDYLRSSVPAFAEHFNVVADLNASGVMNNTVSISFSNVYATLLKQKALAEQRYAQTGDVEARQEMTDTNMSVAQVLGVHILQYLIPNGSIQDKAEASSLGLEDIINAVPEVSLPGLMIERSDDLEDFYADLYHEMNTGIYTPNSLVTDLARTTPLYGLDIDHELVDFFKINRAGVRFFPILKLPETMRRVVEAASEHFLQSAEGLPKHERSVILAVWDGIRRRGLKMPLAPELKF